MNTTYLNAFHHAEGGNMVNFAGWEMPINYGSQINEHNLVRQQVGVFDVSHMAVFDLKGDNQISFLEKLLPNNINKINYFKKKGCRIIKLKKLNSKKDFDFLLRKIYKLNKRRAKRTFFS